MEKSEYQVTVKIDTDEAVFEDQEEWAHGDNMNVEDQVKDELMINVVKKHFSSLKTKIRYFYHNICSQSSH